MMMVVANPTPTSTATHADTAAPPLSIARRAPHMVASVRAQQNRMQVRVSMYVVCDN